MVSAPGAMLEQVEAPIAIIGPYPRPYGGISVHIKRTLDLLKKNNVCFLLFDESKESLRQADISAVDFSGVLSRGLGILKLIFVRFQLIHYHSPSPYGRLFLCLLGLFKSNIFLHIHGASLRETLLRPGFSLMLPPLLSKVHLIADNRDIYELCAKYNPRSLSLIDAFIPPLVDELGRHKGLESHVDKDVDLVISMVGWFEEFLGEDLYGFDTACEAINILQENHNVQLLVSCNGFKSEKVLNNFNSLVAKYCLQKKIVVIAEDLEEAWPLFYFSDVFIRPTRSDGSALSVKEALWVKTPVIASDVVPREKEVILFKCGSGASLASALLKVLGELEKPALKCSLDRAENFIESHPLFKDIYQI